MRNGLCSKLLVIYFLLLTACGDINISTESDVDDINKKEVLTEVEPPNQITVTGKIMLGPVVRGHSLQLIIYGADRKELARPKVDYNGSYSFVLEDYKGIILSQVTSTNPDQCSDDYIDEATAKPKCLGNSTILSSTYVESGTSNNQAKLYTTPATTVAVLYAGVELDNNGGLTLPKGLTQDRIIQSNKVVAKIFGLGDQDITKYKPTSLITKDQKFQTGDAYTNALAAISGAETEGKELNTVVKQISTAIKTDNNIPSLDPVIQDMMIRGIQEVAERIKEKSDDNSILKNLSNYQKTFPKSIITVDLIPTLPKSPIFTNQTKTKTSDLKPIWYWQSGGSYSGKYEYRVGETDRIWKPIESNSFTPNSEFKVGQYTLIIREADAANPNLWSKPTKSTIEILDPVKVPKTEPPVAKEPKTNPPETKAPATKEPKAKPPEVKEPENIISNDLPNIISNITSVPSAIEYHDYSLDLLIKDNDNETITVKLIDASPLWLKFSNRKEEITLTKNTNNLFLETLSGDPWQEDIGINKFTLRINENKPDQKDFLFEIEVKESTTKFKVELIGKLKQNHTLQFKLINEDKIEQGSFSYYWITLNNPKKTYKKTYSLTQQDVGQKIYLFYDFIEKDSGERRSYVGETETVIEDVDEPPQISNLPNLTANIGEIYKFKPNVIDPDADQNFRFTINKVPEWATFNTIDGSLTGTPEIDDADIYDIVITVIDSTGLIGETKPFDIQLSRVNFRNDRHTEIKVCWQFADNIHDDTLSKNEVSNQIKDYIQDIAIRSWEQHSAVSFKGWSICTENDLKNDSPTLKIAFERYFNRSNYDSLEHTVNFTIVSNQVDKFTIIHEFGHALGFPHEHERWDTFINVGEVCVHIDRPYPIQNPDKNYIFEKRKSRNIKVINRLEWQQQQYNPFSIMNYCTSAYEYYSNHVKSPSLLSISDINRVQQFYGASSDTGRHLMDGDEFFTGLYRAKDQTDYVFYKYGAPYNQSRIDLSHIDAQQYFIIYDDKQERSFLFKFDDNLQYLKPANDPIAVCSPLNLPNNQNNVVPIDCSAVWDHNNYSNNSFYYFDDPFGFTNEFNSLFCQNIQGESLTSNFLTYYFVSLSDDNCIDFNQNIYKPHFFAQNNNQLFINGVAYSGRLNGLADLSFKNGKRIYDQIERQNNKLKRFNYKRNSFVDYSGHITERKNNTSLEPGYYIAGTKINKDNIFSVDEIFKWGHNKPENGYYPADLLRNIIYSYMETNGEKRLLMYDEPYTGVYGEKFYISGLQSNESKFEIIKGINYVIHEETNHLSSIKLSRLKYKFKKNKYGTLWGFNPSNLGNGKNSYYTQGYPTTKLCLSYGYCTNENQSVDYIHQIFSHYGKDYIYAWINVWTEYSKFDENGNIRPILFKGNNPLSGDFDGKTYSYGYPE